MKKRAKRQGYVYFIERGRAKMIRIGFTRRPAGRFIEHRKKYGAGLRLLGILSGGQSAEAAVHKKFDHLRIGRSEWFNIAPELTDYINGRAVWEVPFCDIAQKALDGAFDRRPSAATIKNNLATIMSDRKLSIYDLAMGAGLPPSIIKSLVSSRRIDLDALAAVCEALKLTPESVLSLEKLP